MLHFETPVLAGVFLMGQMRLSTSVVKMRWNFLPAPNDIPRLNFLIGSSTVSREFRFLFSSKSSRFEPTFSPLCVPT